MKFCAACVITSYSIHYTKLYEFLTDGGIETTLVFHKGIDLPEFASFPLLRDAKGREILRDCLRPYLDLTRKYDVGIVIETQTWRASRDWAKRLAISSADLERLV